MIEAHIVGPHGSLYFSAPATPYDLQTLRTHVRDANSASPHQVHVELTVDRADLALAPRVSNLVRELTRKGVAVHLV
jgi:hypothetical protein